MSLIIERIEDEQLIPAELLDEAVLEFRKYLCLRWISDKPLAMLSKIVDEVWHNFIRFSPEYIAFCERVYGGYLHHRPTTRTEKAAGNHDSVWNFVELYNLHYGPLGGVWPPVDLPFWLVLRAMSERYAN